MPKCTPSGKKMSSPSGNTVHFIKITLGLLHNPDFGNTQGSVAQSLSQQMLLSIYYVLDTVHSKQGQNDNN